MEQIQQLSTPELKEHWRKEVEQNLALVRNYIEWKDSWHGDFEMGKAK